MDEARFGKVPPGEAPAYEPGTGEAPPGGKAPDSMAAALARDRRELGEGSAPDRVAHHLRARIAEGLFPPGGHLSEEALGLALGVSRNTLREAFRLLCHEGLVVHELHRGFSVRRLTVDDVVDLYRFRRLVECAAVRQCANATPAVRLAVLETARLGEAAAAADDWDGVQTAIIRFHQAVAGLVGSRRLDELMRQVLAELRLAFHAVAEPRQVLPPFVNGHRVVAELVLAGAGAQAERELSAYLDAAEAAVLSAFGRPHGTRPAGPSAVLPPAL